MIKIENVDVHNIARAIYSARNAMNSWDKSDSGLERQKKFILIPSQKDENEKTIERECSYIADFVYVENNETIVEDVKGYRKGGAYAVFAIKRKLMLQKYGIRVKEV